MPTANTRYNDLTGTVAADFSDVKSYIDTLHSTSKASGSEDIAGYRLLFPVNNGGNVSEIELIIYLIDRNPPNLTRKIKEKMHISEFFSYFKRFDLVIIDKDVDIDES